jgi:hypothetical protein
MGMHHRNETHGAMNPEMVRRHYVMLGVNLILSLFIMYIAMFVMIWSWGEFIQNINFFYMALVMWAPMAAVMLLTMKAMYPNKKLNSVLYPLFGVVFVLSLWGVRDQLAVTDKQFLRSMIPHHSGAILMCEKAKLSASELRTLCGQIIQSQKQEIQQMKVILARK